MFGAALGLALVPRALAQTQDDARRPASEKTENGAPEEGSRRPASVWDLLLSSGVVGLAIVCLSVAAMALAIDHALTLRRKVLMPPGLASELHARISAGEFAMAEQDCKLRPSYLAYVVLAGLQEVSAGYPAVEKAMEDASQDQAGRLFRKIEYLALIGNLAPMLGLLGTVYGILLAFKRVAETQGTAVAADLADGVYLALVTTVEGLVVAIPSLGAYAIFRNRVEQLAGDVGRLAEQVFADFKRNTRARTSSS